MKNVDKIMSNIKPLGKMTKAELLELAKDSKDTIRSLDFKLTTVYADKEALEIKYQKLMEKHKLIESQSKINQKMINRYNAQKVLISEESGQVKVGTYKIPSPCKVRLLQFKSWILGLFK